LPINETIEDTFIHIYVDPKTNEIQRYIILCQEGDGIKTNGQLGEPVYINAPVGDIRASEEKRQREYDNLGVSHGLCQRCYDAKMDEFRQYKVRKNNLEVHF
jgi:hypothetical protein